jgi:hypothetical protein
MATLTQLPDDVDLSFVAGDTFRIRVRVVDPSAGTPLPLTQYEFVAEIARNPDRAIVAQFTVAPDPDNPTLAVILTLTPAETAALPGMGDGKQFSGIWDLEVTFPNDDVRTVAKGTVTCVLDVSNAAADRVVAANMGTPGTWSPTNGVRPANVAALTASAVKANPATPWAAGTYVQTGTAGAAGEASWNGTAWVAGRRP